MRLTLAEPKFLKESISIISDLIDEATFKVTSQSIKLVAMDSANVAMVIFELYSSNFIEYELEEDVEFTINLMNLRQILRRVSSNDALTLELKDNRLIIIIKGKSTKEFNLSIYEAEESEHKVPSLEFGASVALDCSMLSDVVEDASIVTEESIAFIVDNNKIVFLAESETNKARIEVKDNIKITKDSEDIVKSKYSIAYLKKMISGSKIADIVNIFFGNDYPLKLEYKVVDKVQLSFILAPRIEND
jgi:proliferating cell nuclear antigen